VNLDSTPWDGGMADPLETRASTGFYHAEFGHSRSNRMGVGRLNSKIHTTNARYQSTT